ncbi:MAG: CRTAC1 family protein [Planctomycetaceae bacterium]
MLDRSVRASVAGVIVAGVIAGCEPEAPVTLPPDASATIPAASSSNGPLPATSTNPAGHTASGGSAAGTIRLVEVPPAESGVDFLHVSGDSEEKPFPAANGSGGGAIDVDQDGLFDLYFATGAPFPLTSTEASPSNRCYRNLGDWKFQEITAEAGLTFRGYSAGVAVADFDSDGFPDLYVTCFGENQWFRNLGDGTFENAPISPGGNFSTSAAWLDYNGDGLVDLYVGNYGHWSFEENQYCGDRSRGVRIFCSPNSLEPEPDRLLQNLGDGTFLDATSAAGVDQVTGRAQGVLATDVNADGNTDLYIGNDIHPNFLFLNDGDGHFADATELSGAAYDGRGQMQAGMGVASADINHDGRLDLFVTNFEGEQNTLYLQSAPDTFYDASNMLGLAPDSKPWVGWGTAFVDFNLDGWKDVIVTNGHVDNNLPQMGRDVPYEQPALVWQNNEGRFRCLADSAGSWFRVSHPGRGLITADLDNDGDTDIVVTQQDQHPALLRNDSPEFDRSARNSVTLRLIGRESNRDAIGTRIEITSAETPRVECIQNGGSYLSAHDSRLIIPVDPSGTADLKILWPSGAQSMVIGLKASQNYAVIEPSTTEPASISHSPAALPTGKVNRDFNK